MQHTIGMLVIGTEGLDIAMASADELFDFKIPRIPGVKLTGTFPPRVSAKDLVLEMLKRYDELSEEEKMIQ
jgi:aconitate hydratase